MNYMVHCYYRCGCVPDWDITEEEYHNYKRIEASQGSRYGGFDKVNTFDNGLVEIGIDSYCDNCK